MQLKSILCALLLLFYASTVLAGFGMTYQNYNRGLFHYAHFFWNEGRNLMLEKMAEGGESAHILDSGSGNCILGVDIFSTDIDVNDTITMGQDYPRTWSDLRSRGEQEARDFEELFPTFRELYASIRKNPPFITHISAGTPRSLSEDREVFQAERNALKNPKIRVLHGQRYQDIEDQEILGAKGQVDMVFDIFGAVNYSIDSFNVVARHLKLLRVGGFLFIAVDKWKSKILVKSDSPDSEATEIPLGILLQVSKVVKVHQIVERQEWYALAIEKIAEGPNLFTEDRS